VNGSSLPLHAALLAWARLGNRVDEGCSVELISHNEKSTVFRLRNGGPAGAEVIAKKVSPETAALESKVYHELLPQLPVTRVELLGALSDEGSAWLFLTHACGDTYSHKDLVHCTAVGEWLAAVHTSAADHPLLAGLPNRDPEYFLGRLRLARWQVRRRLASEGFDPHERSVLSDVLTQCDVLESGWNDLVEECAALPQTLVHGDFSASNIRVTLTGEVANAYVFDWEKSGRGSIAVDFVRGLDIAAYHAVAGGRWQSLSIERVERMAAYGRILRPLTHNWSKKPVPKIEDHYVHMNKAMKAVGWSTGEA
jgi:Ser/Thr protein kinase RdoA (MazF antagonist)